MNARKTLTAVLFGSLLALSLGCANKGATARAKQPITSEQMQNLYSREANDSPVDYVVIQPTYRLMGVTPGDGVNGYVTLADTTTWQTRNYHVGDLMSRNLKVADMGDGYVDLVSSTDGPLHLNVGDEVSTNAVFHVYDRAFLSQGNLQFSVDSAAVARVYQAHGSGVSGAVVNLNGYYPVQLTSVDPKGVYGRMGLVAGDLIFGYQGNPVAPADLDNIAVAMSTPGQTYQLSVGRNGSVLNQTYTVH